jgi:hypothetical protein
VHDQLLKQFHSNPSFGLRDFREESLRFHPTFKYERNTSSYETEKMRVPAYCDRILFKFDRYTNREKIKVLEYRALDIRMSDHRPVLGMFEIDVKKVDGAKLSDTEGSVWNLVRAMKKL